MAEGLVGRTLLDGEYTLRGVLGRGGMATVYRAYSRSLDTEVAVKVLAPRLASSTSFRERFRDEARSLAHLHHPNLIEVHHYGEERDLVYIVMRLVPAGTLKDRQQALEQPFGLVTTARLISQVADALQHAHDRGLVHLDIKPANILLGRADWPLLADFGITRAVSRQETARGGERYAGTPLYMSPEQWQGGPVDGRSDQYSLAITTYELLTGRRPFQAETTEEIHRQHLQTPPPRPRALNPGIPGPVEEVLLRGMAKAPEDRFPSIREFGAALAGAVERTRGVTLETKQALAAITPNFLGILSLILFGPVLLSILPVGTQPGGAFPLAWPVQLVLSILATALLLGIRWHLIGLITRALSAALRWADQASRGYGRPLAPGDLEPWRNAVAGSAEGAVNLLYLLVAYRLILVPILTILGMLIDPTTLAITASILSGLVVLIALSLVVRIYRGGGPVVAAVFLALAWMMVSVLPFAHVASAAGLSLIWLAKIVISLGLIMVLLATRRAIRERIGSLLAAGLGSLGTGLGAPITREGIAAARRGAWETIGTALDFLYLLVGYALLRQPLTEGLTAALGPLTSVALVSGLALLVWVILTFRWYRQAGIVGLTLALLLGAPLLVSLPLFSLQALGAAWPSTVVAWVVGTALALSLAASRASIQGLSRRALGPALDQRMLGTVAAPDEEGATRRVGALGGMIGALIDVALLVIGYWALGPLVAVTLARATGQSHAGFILLLGLIGAALAILVGSFRRAAVVIGETGGPLGALQARALPALAAVAAIVLIGGSVAAPAALAAPAAAGGLALEAPEAPAELRVLVKVELPPAFQYRVIRLSVAGLPVRQGTIDGRTAWFEVSDIAPGAVLAATLDFPEGVSLTTPVGTPVPTATLAPRSTNTPTLSPTSTATATPSPSATASATATPTTTSTATPTATVTVAPIVVAAATPTIAATRPVATATLPPSATPTPPPTATPTASLTPTPTATTVRTPTLTPTNTPRPTSTSSPRPSPNATATLKPSPTFTVTPTGPRILNLPTSTPSPAEYYGEGVAIPVRDFPTSLILIPTSTPTAPAIYLR